MGAVGLIIIIILAVVHVARKKDEKESAEILQIGSWEILHTGTESAIGIPADFIPMFCIVQNNTVTTSGANITDVGTQGVASAYVAGCVVASSSAQSVMFACNGANGIGSAGSGTTAGIPLTADEVMVTMVDPGLSAASVTVTLLGVSNTTTLDLST